MCTADKKIDRLELSMSKIDVRVSVLETKLDSVIESLEEIKVGRAKEIDRIIEALEDAKKEACLENKNLEKGLRDKRWKVIFAVLSAFLSLSVMVLGSFLINGLQS